MEADKDLDPEQLPARKAAGEGCVNPACDGYMVDFHPREHASGSGFNLVKIVCLKCGATAWRIAGRNGGSTDNPRVAN
jgi:hypothetical protein